jgi:hypothetical protein
MTFQNKATVVNLHCCPVKYLVVNERGLTNFEAVEDDDSHIVWVDISVASDIRDYYNGLLSANGKKQAFMVIVHVPTVTA